MKYQCTITSGGGTEIDAGIWEKKETDKTISFSYIDDLHSTPNFTSIKINKFYSNKKPRKDGNYNAFRDYGAYIGWFNNGNVIRDWKDGTFTAYPEQCGTPYYFTPIKIK